LTKKLTFEGVLKSNYYSNSK